MRIIKTKSYEEMSKKAANIIASVVTLKPDCMLGLATGSSPIGTYDELVKKYEAGDLDFSEVTTVNLDEYKGLPKENEQSYYYFMHDNLFQHINIPEESIHVLSGTADDLEKECADYDAMIDRAGGIDLQILGIGRNGHIAFNEPTTVFPPKTHIVDLTESTIDANKRFFADVRDVPRQALTMGIGSIMKARAILIIATGADKAQAVKDMIQGPVDPQCPASILQLHPDVTVMLDAPAASLLG